MAKKQNLIRELAEFKKNVNKVIPIDKLILFGSHATGKTHKWSDVDLVIVSTKFKRISFMTTGISGCLLTFFATHRRNSTD